MNQSLWMTAGYEGGYTNLWYEGLRREQNLYNDLYVQFDYKKGPWIISLGDRFRHNTFWDKHYDEGDGSPERTAEIRGELRDLDDHYEHLMDLAEVFEENENGFFKDEGLRYFRVFYNRVDKLRDQAETLRDQAMQVRDLYKMHLDIKQNNIMTVLTIVTAIFAPLTLIVGWYGMNFVFMPELEWRYSYPVVFVACVVFAIGAVVFFKKKKWL
jgi:magnesium transporter